MSEDKHAVTFKFTEGEAREVYAALRRSWHENPALKQFTEELGVCIEQLDRCAA